jgi:hypothetical protein
MAMECHLRIVRVKVKHLLKVKEEVRMVRVFLVIAVTRRRQEDNRKVVT